jgi:uncharacterized protein YqeY
MTFTEKINADIKSAMLAKEKEKLAALRDIKSKLLLESTSGNGEVTEEAALKIIMKLHKQRMETYTLYMEQNREDLAKEELDQAKVIEAYLPKMLTEEEVRLEVQNTISELGVTSPQEIGKVMGVLTKKLAGKADGKIISALAKEELSK